MLFSRVSGDNISKSYGHLKILFEIFYFMFFSLPVDLVTGLGVAEVTVGVTKKSKKCFSRSDFKQIFKWS